MWFSGSLHHHAILGVVNDLYWIPLIECLQFLDHFLCISILWWFHLCCVCRNQVAQKEVIFFQMSNDLIPHKVKIMGVVFISKPKKLPTKSKVNGRVASFLKDWTLDVHSVIARKWPALWYILSFSLKSVNELSIACEVGLRQMISIVLIGCRFHFIESNWCQLWMIIHFEGGKGGFVWLHSAAAWLRVAFQTW